jgi:hypothetical protein
MFDRVTWGDHVPLRATMVSPGEEGRVPMFHWPAFIGNGRADLVEAHAVVSADGGSPLQWLYLNGPVEAALQVEMAGGVGCVMDHVPDHSSSKFSHVFRCAGGVPPDVLGLVELLEEIPTLRQRAHVSAAVVLDWYKIPEDDVDPHLWANTEAGELVHKSKYRTGTACAVAKGELLDRMVDVINRHPLFRAATSIVTVPGSAADGQSFGERLARKVAETVEKPHLDTVSVFGPRPPRKQGGTPLSEDAFALPASVSGDVLIVDDVYSSGGSMGAAAYAALRAGAERVFGLSAARTMKN